MKRQTEERIAKLLRRNVTPGTDQARSRQAEEKVATAEMRRHKLEQEAAAEKERREMLAERKRRIDLFTAAALTGLLADGQSDQYAIREAPVIGRRVVEEMDKEAPCS